MDDIQIIVDEIASLQEDMDMIQQPRSNFALKHFVVGQHDMPGRQRAQAVLELQNKLFGIRRSQIAREKTLTKIKRQTAILETGNTLDQVEATLEIEGLEIDIQEIDLALKGAAREARALLDILAAMPKYTREQLEAEELEYWQRRLTRQYVVGQRDIGGNLDAALQIYTEPGQTKPMDLGTFQDIAALLGKATP